MPRIIIKIGTAEKYRASVLKATPLGALSTDAIVSIGPVDVEGPARALRHLADALNEAANRADAYDLDVNLDQEDE